MNSNIFSNMASLDATFNTSLDHLSNAYSDHHLPTISFHDHPRSNIPMFDSMAHFFSSGLGSDAMSMASEPQMMLNSSPLVPGTCFIEPAVSKKHQEQGYGGKKRKRSNEKEMENQREVVHVRAKRGQATDSHSLAERLRREKINDKLRCLQDLVPGCYKTMGMAVMLDVIINYVRSLQNQIDFLSMKLSAASLFYDFNSSEAEAMETLQGSAAYEAGQMMEKLVDGYGENSQFQTPWPL